MSRGEQQAKRGPRPPAAPSRAARAPADSVRPAPAPANDGPAPASPLGAAPHAQPALDPAPPARRRLALLAIPVLLVALLGELLWFAPWDQTAPPPARSQPLPLADVNPLGAHVFLEREVDPLQERQDRCSWRTTRACAG